MLRFARAILAVIGTTVASALAFLVIAAVLFHGGSPGDGIAIMGLLLLGVLVGLCVGIVLAANPKPVNRPN